MYNGSDRRKAQPSAVTTELTGDGRPWRARATASSPLNRQTEEPRLSRHALTRRQKLMIESLEQRK
jgi:hypothetical protein